MVSEFVELAVISCSGTRFESGEGVATSANSRAGFNCTVSEFVELAVISCSGTRFESGEGVAPSANSRAGFNCTVSEFVELAVINCSGTGYIPPIRSLAFTEKNHISTYYRHSLRKQGI